MEGYNTYNTSQGVEMTEDPLVQARKRAEHAVEGMKEGPLKVAAFQAILTKLLADSDRAEEGQRTSAKAPPSTVKHPDSLRGRVLTIKSEGFFKTQRSLGEVREALGSRGWYIPLTTLSGVMQGLVQRRLLRRERVSAGKKNVWKYSNP
jgi:hypothetical protein